MNGKKWLVYAEDRPDGVHVVLRHRHSGYDVLIGVMAPERKLDIQDVKEWAKTTQEEVEQ